MTSIILITISTIFFLPYVIIQHRKKHRSNKNINIQRLHQVEAGATKRFMHRKLDLTPMVDVDIANIQLSSGLQYFLVRNQCMKVKGISDGDIIGVKMFDDKFTMTANQRAGQILLIYLDDSNFKGYKIREQGELVNGGVAFDTYHYKNGKKNKSTKPHAITSIKGIVVEVHQRQYVESVV